MIMACIYLIYNGKIAMYAKHANEELHLSYMRFGDASDEIPFALQSRRHAEAALSKVSMSLKLGTL